MRRSNLLFSVCLLKCKNIEQTLHENSSRMCQASNSLYYSPQKALVKGLTRIKTGKLGRISIIVMEESEHILVPRRDLPDQKGHKKPGTGHEGASQLSFITASQMETRESRILPACLERPLTPLGQVGRSERAGLCHQLSKTGQDRPNPAGLTDVMMISLLLIASGQIFLMGICYRERFDDSEQLYHVWLAGMEVLVLVVTSSGRCNTGNITS